MSFYTYMHVRESDGKAFYVGKGQGRRAWSHRGRSDWWQTTKAKHGLRVEILAQWPVEAEAFQHERFMIQCLRDLAHPLVNLTDGGEGFAGGKHSLEWRQNLSAKTKGRPGKPTSEETKAKLRALVKANPPMYWLGKKLSPEAISKRTASRKYVARKHSEGGLTMTIGQWAKHLDMHRTSIDYRLKVGKPLIETQLKKGQV